MPERSVSSHRVEAALARRLGARAEALRPKGMAHAHYRLVGRGPGHGSGPGSGFGPGLIARVPRWSQVGLDPAANLAHQAAAFDRAFASGHTPRLAGVIEPADDLPMGALLVAEIVGRPPRLPDDMPAIARALAALHALPVPPAEARAPLASPPDPVAATVAVIGRQAPFFDRAGLHPDTAAHLAAELAWARTLPPAPDAPVTLVGTDTHPGNFLIDAGGKAWFIDLEKAMYGLPAIDLAHASLYSSTTWDPDVDAVLDGSATAAFYDAWAEAVPPALAEATHPWFAPARRLTWLRTLSWMARWSVEGGPSFGSGIDPQVTEHVARRIADFFDPATIARVRRTLSVQRRETP